MTFRKQLIFWSMTCAAATLWADVSLPTLFSDGMVIQRETLAPIWGSADPGEQVQVEASWGANATRTAQSDGSWKLALQTPAAGGPFEIRITGKNQLVIKDVLAGEVWLCGGQSNMDYDMARFARKAHDPVDQPAADYNNHERRTAIDPLLRHIEVPHKASPYKKQDDFKGKWVSVNRKTTSQITATGYYFARELRKQLQVPVGLVECSWAGSRVEPWISAATYQGDPELAAYYQQEMIAWKKKADAYSAEEAQQKLEQALAKWTEKGEKGRKPRLTPDPVGDMQWPATLHNGMISAIVPYAMKGVIWYQGESNRSYMTAEYENRFRTLVSSWRAEWNQGDFPFYWAQLAAFSHINEEPIEENGWASICDMQRRCLTLPNSGMAVLNDIGEAGDIHPRNKLDAGKRLARWALAKDYGYELPYSGPLYKRHLVKGQQVIIQFDHVGAGLMVGHKEGIEPTVPSDEPLKRFQIAGADREWKWADVEIVSADTISVTHPEVRKPTVVRYAWSSNPEGANLYNKDGLPASTFTTE